MSFVRNFRLCVELGDFELATSFKHNLLKELDKRMGSVDQMTMLAAATIIDPQFKMYFTNPIYCARAIEFIHHMMKKDSQNREQSEIGGKKRTEPDPDSSICCMVFL